MAGSNPVLCGSIAGRPGRFGVAMHTAGYRALGLPYTYVAFGTEDTAGAVAAMRALGIRGLGVTMPHKVRIMEHLDVLDETAREIGAVNTVVNDDGRLTGHNVDWIGALRAFREAIDAPLMANMTEFGRSPLLDLATLQRLGYDLVIYPVTTLRLAMGAIERGLRAIHDEGTQERLVPELQTRARLYELLRYGDHEAFDAAIAGFEPEAGDG